jgi:hypothetical protein
MTPGIYEQYARVRGSALRIAVRRCVSRKRRSTVVPVGPERCGAPEAEALVQADGFGLINPRFQSQQDNPMLPDMRGQMVQHQPAQASAESARSGRMIGASAATASQKRTRSARLAGWASALIDRQSVHSDSSLQQQGTEDLNKPQVL